MMKQKIKMMRAIAISETGACILRKTTILSPRFVHADAAILRQAPWSDRVGHHGNPVRCFSHVSSLEHPLVSSTSLGLFRPFVSPHIESLRVLPEIDMAELSEPSPHSIVSLLRAVQIFEATGGPLYLAVLALLADAYQQTGQYESAIQILNKLLEDQSLSQTTIQMALAKVLCYQGDFDQALKITTKLLDLDETQASIVSRGVILSTHGTIQLLQLTPESSLETAYEVMEILRVAARSLESMSVPAFNNLGIAQVVTDAMFLDTVRVDPAMTSFHKDLRITVDPFLKGRIYNNMITTLLLDDNEDDYLLKIASDYSRSAIQIFESATTLAESERRAGLHRALGLAAKCYFRVDAAVTAEGLFKTAMETTKNDPLTKIAQRDIIQNYAELCRKWDKRAADADDLLSKSSEIEQSLTDPWRDKHGILSGIVFPNL